MTPDDIDVSFQCFDDAGKAYLLRRTAQPVASARAANAFEDAPASQPNHNLFQVTDGDFFLFRDGLYGDGFFILLLREQANCTEAITAFCRNSERHSIVSPSVTGYYQALNILNPTPIVKIARFWNALVSPM
jgi:hypothetical protein